MAFEDRAVSIPMQLAHGALIVPIQIDLSEPVILRLQHDLLARLQSEHNVRGVVLDLSGVDILDSHEFELLRKTLVMASLMGTRGIITGLGPGIVSALVDLGVELSNIETAMRLEDALDMLA